MTRRRNRTAGREQDAARARVIEALRQAMLRDRTVSGATVIFADGGRTYITRGELLRQPERADA